MQRLIPASGLSALVLASALVVTPAFAQQATVYKWVDSQGVPHYSDQPPMDSVSEAMPIRYRRTDRAAVQGRLQASEARQGAEELREEQQDATADTEATQREKDLAERAATCKQATERVTNYNQAQKLYKPGPNGDRIYLTSEELDAERADAQRVMEEWCSDE